MKDLVIIGASGFGREIAWLVERINKVEPTWNIVGFVDDNEEIAGQVLNGYPVLGATEKIAELEDTYAVCAIGAAKIRKLVIEKVMRINPAVKFATLIDPDAIVGDLVAVGEGTMICAGSILTVNIEIGKHVIINLDCTVGHDAVMDDYVTLYPSVNVSGFTHLETMVEMGTGSQIIQMKKIGTGTIVGAGSVVVKDLPEKCTAVGIPAKPIKFFE